MEKKWKANSLTFKVLKAFGHLPTQVRYPIIRKFVNLSYELPDNYVFKVAETQDEIEQALTILHNGFVERDLIDPHRSRMRITKYHCLPTTDILILKVGDEVAATITTILDSKFGLPTDEYRNLGRFRDQGQRIVEISGLAIKPKFRGSNGKLLMPLCKYLWSYVSQVLKADIMIISTKLEARDIYRAILLFEGLDDDKIVDVESLKGSTTSSQWVAVNAHEKFKKVYGKEKRSKNVYHYFTEHSFKNMVLPVKPYYTAFHSVLKPSVMTSLFKEKSSLFKTLSDKEKKQLHKIFFFPEFRSVIGEINVTLPAQRDIRVQTFCQCAIIKAGSFLQARVEDVSKGGLKLFGAIEDLTIGEVLKLKVQLGPGITTFVTGQVAWVAEGRYAGVELGQVTNSWLAFIDYAEELFEAQTLKYRVS